MQTHRRAFSWLDPYSAFYRATLQEIFDPGMHDCYQPKPQLAFVKPNTFTFLRHWRMPPIQLDATICENMKAEYCEISYPIMEMETFPLLHNWPCPCGAVVWRLR